MDRADVGERSCLIECAFESAPPRRARTRCEQQCSRKKAKQLHSSLHEGSPYTRAIARINGIRNGTCPKPFYSSNHNPRQAKGPDMQINETMNTAFNSQITMELQAAHSYLAMAAWFATAGFPGMAGWMHTQSAEETQHALKFYHFVLDRDGRVALGSLDAPKADFADVISVFEAGLAQEREVTKAINSLYSLAMEEKDFASLPLLDWFVTEQIEEESTFSQILDDLNLAGESPQAILFLDREFGARGAVAE